MKLRVIPIIIIMVLLVRQVAAAETLDPSGSEIAAQAQRNIAAFSAFTADMEMTSNDTDGEKTIYKLRLAAVREKEGGTKKLFLVDEPANLMGTALLIDTRQDRDSSYWLYLSAGRRVRRIYPVFQTGWFLSSEWTYEDMKGHVAENAAYQLIGSDTIEGRPCFLIEATPEPNALSGYSKLNRWIDKETYDLRKIEYYDHQNTLLKTLFLNKYEGYQGNFRHPRRMLIIDHKSGKTLQVDFSNFRFDGGMENLQFDKAGFYKGSRSKGEEIQFSSNEKRNTLVKISPR